MEINQKESELVILSDTHIYARIWSERERAGILPSGPEQCLTDALGNLKPNQTLVINGDLVHSISSHGEIESDNFERFRNILNKCQNKCYLNLGNHDYRLRDYRGAPYKLVSIFRGANKAELFNKQVRTQLPYYVEEGDKELVFLNTGPDAFATRHTKMWKRLLVLGIYWRNAISYGIEDGEMDFLAKRLKETNKKTVVLFLHAPPFMAKDRGRHLNLERGVSLPYLFIKRFAHQIFLKNATKFIKKVSTSDKNIVVITSHIHEAREFVLDKSKKAIWETDLKDINAKLNDDNFVKFISTEQLSFLEKDKRKRKMGRLVWGKEIEREVLYDLSAIQP